MTKKMRFFAKIKEKLLEIRKKAVPLYRVQDRTPRPGPVPGNLFSVMTQFEIGKVYECHSICDYDCIWTYTVIARTASTVTLVNDTTGKIQKNRILGYSKQFGYEIVRPLGNYSMCPTLCADSLKN